MAKKLISGIFCAMLLAMVSTTVHAASMVSIYLREIDPYGLVVAYGNTSQRIVDTAGYSSYGTCPQWSGAGTLYGPLSSYRKASFDNVPAGTRSWLYQDRYCQPWRVTYQVSGQYTVDNTTLDKYYSNITAVNPDGTPYTGTITQKIYVGYSGANSLPEIARFENSKECARYKSGGYETWLMPRIWTGGSEKWSIYLVEGSNWVEYSYSELGVYTSGAWDLALTFNNASTRNSGAKTIAVINKNVKDKPVRKNMKFKKAAAAAKIIETETK